MPLAGLMPASAMIASNLKLGSKIG